MDGSSPQPASTPLGPEAFASDEAYVHALARQRLPADVAEHWISLLRPAARLVAAGSGEEVVARLGGRPSMPAGVEWPTWNGHGPLAYIGEVNCAPLTRIGLDIALPASGRMLFFYFDGSYDNFQGIVGTWDPASLAGARMIFVPDNVDCTEVETPPGVEEYLPAELAARMVVTAPNWEHPVLQAAFMQPGQDTRAFLNRPVNDDAFQQALYERHKTPLHQIGGYADPDQGPVEFEVAEGVLGGKGARQHPDFNSEAARWTLLLQVDSDDSLGMMWGDVGKLYWLARRDDLERGDLSAVSFTWQCG